MKNIIYLFLLLSSILWAEDRMKLKAEVLEVNQEVKIKIGNLEPIKYKIKEGDTLSKISRERGVTLEKLLELNPRIKNKDLIYTGDILIIKR